jgi:hypothetical protein
MRTFKDNAERAWCVEINVATLKRVRGLTGTDLLGVLEGPLIEKLVRDPVLLCDVVYAVIKPQADAAGVSDEQFGGAMAGDAIDAAWAALTEELVSFCPSPRDRANLGRVIQGARDVMEKARQLVKTRLDSGVIEKLGDRLLERAGTSFTDALASPVSTPDLSPSATS